MTNQPGTLPRLTIERSCFPTLAAALLLLRSILLLTMRTIVALSMTRPTWVPPTHHGANATMAPLSIWLGGGAAEAAEAGAEGAIGAAAKGCIVVVCTMLVLQ